MPVYIIAQIDIHDSDKYEEYRAGFHHIFSKFKGEILTVSEEPVVI